MKRVLLIHQDSVQHYRVAIYNYLSNYLKIRGFELFVVSNGIEPVNPHPVNFIFEEVPLGIQALGQLCRRLTPCAVIFFVNLRHYYLFPVLFVLKLKKVRTIYWGHGLDLESRNNRLKNLLYKLEHKYFDALILYAEHLKKFIAPKYHGKVFVANNTLSLQGIRAMNFNKDEVFAKYGITTKKNIIFVGRKQRRKRLDDLITAFRMIDSEEVGLILVGPDADYSTKSYEGERIYNVGALYAEEVYALLAGADVYCIPGHVGLGIVDAFFFGLPLVTENVDHAPEIMYLRDGENGFMVPKGDVGMLSKKLSLLLFNDALRLRFSQMAIEEVATNGSLDRMCGGFYDALSFVCPGE